MSDRNIASFKPLYYITSTCLNILRTIPDVVLAVIFVGLFGVGVLSGMFALIIFSLGILAKLLGETVEAVDMDPLEAMRASGGSTLQVLCYGLVPRVLRQSTAFVFYAYDSR